MSDDLEAFNDCPQGVEVETFHERILNGLNDSFAELGKRRQEILALAPARRDPDENQFLALYDDLQEGLLSLKASQQPYDQKYGMALKLRELINELDLL